MYQVLLERSAEKDLKRLPRNVQPRVISVLRTLASQPRPPGSRKLTGTKTDWRVRVGDYRIVYEVADAIRVVRVHRIRHRGDVYR